MFRKMEGSGKCITTGDRYAKSGKSSHLMRKPPETSDRDRGISGAVDRNLGTQSPAIRRPYQKSRWEVVVSVITISL
jgi:hypothetical protein